MFNMPTALINRLTKIIKNNKKSIKRVKEI